MSRSRRGWAWAAVVAALMVVAFAIGAFVASRMELFPPQVDAAADVVPEPSGSGESVPPVSSSWEGTFSSRTLQGYTEGLCRTPWAGAITFEADDAGEIAGSGEVSVGGRPDCPFPLEQPQVDGYTFRVDGRIDGRRMRMRWLRFEPAAGGIVDHGGFGPTIADRNVEFRVRLRPDLTGTVRLVLRAETAEGVATARSRTRIRLGCVEGC